MPCVELHVSSDLDTTTRESNCLSRKLDYAKVFINGHLKNNLYPVKLSHPVHTCMENF